MTAEEFQHLVREERVNQDRKCPWAAGRRDHWARILGEEFGEVCRALNEHRDSNDLALVDELVQLAAVAQRIAEQLP